MIIERKDNVVIVKNTEPGGSIKPVGTTLGTVLVQGDVDFTHGLPTQPCVCLCGKCSGLEYHIHPSVILTGADCPFQSGVASELSPDLRKDGDSRYQAGARNKEDCLLLWEDKKLSGGSLYDPSTHPDWNTTFEGYNKWGQFLGTDYATTDELIAMLHHGIIEECLVWTRNTEGTTQWMREHLLTLLLGVINDYLGCLKARARELNLPLCDLIQLLVEAPDDDARRVLLETPVVASSKKDDGDILCPEEGEDIDISSALKKLNTALKTLPRGYYGSTSNIPEFIIQQMNQLLWMELEYRGSAQLQLTLCEMMPSVRQQFEDMYKQVAMYRTKNRSWMQAYSVYFFVHCGHLLGFNLSDAGSGKTSTVYAIGKELNLKNVLILGTKSTIENDGQWQKKAEREREHTQNIFVCSELSDLNKLDSTRRNYVLVTEYTVQNNSKLVTALSRMHWNMVVLDELQAWSGVGEEEGESIRRLNLRQLISRILEINPKCIRYLMSATPVRVNSEELEQVIEIFSREKIEGSGGEGLSGLLKLRLYLFRNGFRFYINPSLLPSMKHVNLGAYKEAVLLEEPAISGVAVARYQWNQFNEWTDSYLDNEAVMIPHQCKLIESNPELLRLFLEAKCPILYTHFTDVKGGRIIDALKRWVEKVRGGSVLMYTGNNRPPLGLLETLAVEKDRCTIIASAPLSMGLDGLQLYCDTMFILGAPWHYANFEQLFRRIRRQGSVFTEVVAVVLVAEDVAYHENRWIRVRQRREYSRALLDGAFRLVNPQRIEREYLKNRANILQLSGMTLTPEATVVDTTQTLKSRKYTTPDSVMMEHQKFWANSRSVTAMAKRQGDILIANTGRTYNLVEYHAENAASSKAFKSIYNEEILKNPQLRILSLGCGETEPLYARALGIQNVTFVDVFLTEQAYVEYPEVIRVDRNVTGLPNESFDLIVSILSIFCEDYKRSIQEMGRLLAPGGHIIMVESFQSGIRGGKMWVREGILKEFQTLGLEGRITEVSADRHMRIEVQKEQHGKAKSENAAGWNTSFPHLKGNRSADWPATIGGN